MIDKWESFVRFRLDENYRIFITGSNATMLSKEMGTKLTGRHLSKELFPFSYSQYLEFTKQPEGETSSAGYLRTWYSCTFEGKLQIFITLQRKKNVIS